MFTEGKALVLICNLISTFPIVTRLIAVIATDITIRMLSLIRIRIFYFRKPKKVSSDYRQDTEFVELEDTVSYTVQFDYCVYWLLKTIFFSI